MKTVWKYDILQKDVFEQEMPKGAQFLAVQIQYGGPCMWVLVDDQAPLVNRRFLVKGTGQPFRSDDPWEYLGTFQRNAGALVFFLFVEEEK